MPIVKRIRATWAVALTLGLLPLASAGAPIQNPPQPQPHPQANKIRPNVPDIQVLDVQSLGRVGADPKGEIASELVRVRIKNWTSDRTIAGILWEISVYDVDKQKVVEVLKPYTSRDWMSPDITLKLPPGYLIEIPFYINRQVHIDGNRTSQIKIKSYTYKKFDAAADKKPDSISYLIGEEWPYKTDTDPVLIEDKR